MINKLGPVHPGEILKEELEVLGYSVNHFAHKLHVPTNRIITQILGGKRSITADIALRLARFFGTTPEFWLNLQTTYDLKIAEATLGKQIAKEVGHKDAA